jgi:8-oxo-dGTP diphosphatase
MLVGYAAETTVAMARDIQEIISAFPDFNDISDGSSRKIEFVPFSSSIPNHRVTHAYAVPFLESGLCIAARRGDGRWCLPGGTLEPGETWTEALHRELLEETGTSIKRYAAFGAYHTAGDPESYRIVCWADVEIVATPADPDGARGVVEIRQVTPSTAAGMFSMNERHLRPVYLIAEEVRKRAER